MSVDYLCPGSCTYAASKVFLKMDEGCEGYISHGGDEYEACAKDLATQEEISNNQLNRILQMLPYSAMDMHEEPKWFQDCAVAYIRWYKYEQTESPEKPDKSNNSPKTVNDNQCSYWLNYVITNSPEKSSDVLQEIVKSRKYNDNQWQQFTGKSGKVWWEEMQETL
jgi:hypothetical protein